MSIRPYWTGSSGLGGRRPSESAQDESCFSYQAQTILRGVFVPDVERAAVYTAPTPAHQAGLLSTFVTGRQVVVGPIEATATGNIITQMMALGHIASLEEGRQVVRNSFDLITYEPASGTGWKAPLLRHRRLMAASWL